MRGMVGALVFLTVALAGLRVWLSINVEKTHASTAARVLWKILDVYLVFLGLAFGVFLIIMVFVISGQVLQNLS